MNAAAKKQPAATKVAAVSRWTPRQCGRCGKFVEVEKDAQRIRMMTYAVPSTRTDLMLWVHKQCEGGR